MKSEQEILADAGPVGRAIYAVAHPVLFAIAKVFLRLRIVGADRLPPDGPYVLAPVHRSGIDFLVAALVTPRRVRWMAKSNLWNYPVLGQFVQMLGAFKVNRGHADRAALRTGLAALRAGQPLIVFPEGTRKSGDEIVDLFDGAAWLACRARVPVIPVGIAGSEQVMARGKKLPRPSKVVLVIGEPIWPAVSLEGRIRRDEVVRTTDRLRDALEDCYERSKAERSGRPWRGRLRPSNKDVA